MFIILIHSTGRIKHVTAAHMGTTCKRLNALGADYSTLQAKG